MHWWKNINSWLDNHSSLLSAWASLLAIVGIPLLLLGGYSTWLQVKNFINRPEIVLHLDSPKNVSFRLFNISPVLMRDPQYILALWDLNARQEGTGDDPGNLMIPTKSMNYIRPKSGIGPWTIESLSGAASKVPDGHIIFGWASVQCPNCVSRKHYWILIKKGEKVWYSVIDPDEEPSIMKNLSLVLNAGENFLNVVFELVPIEQRIEVVATK